MKVYFLTRKRLLVGMLFLAVLSSFLIISFGYFHKPSQASRLKEPVYQGNSGQKAVAITVNVDWGEEFLPDMLKNFKQYQARVTFFVTGSWAEKNPELLKTMAQEGHSIQNHGYKHVHFAGLAPDQAAQQIKKAEDVIFNITGKRSQFFASPYGEQNRQILQGVQSLNYDLIMWSVDTIDWQRPSPETIIKRVMNKVHNDAIILMHPTEPTSKALPELLKQLQDQGYKMVPIEEIVITPGEKAANQ
ncbi:MAG TPA: polysaccharide deacetylase family protein [Syntrophomonadaceae bacterium]|nr:polysaccharide deacetylase family protein [Syntrophomonadaceae bacterium]